MKKRALHLAFACTHFGKLEKMSRKYVLKKTVFPENLYPECAEIYGDRQAPLRGIGSLVNKRVSLFMFSPRSRAEGTSHESLNIWLVLEQYGTKMTKHTGR